MSASEDRDWLSRQSGKVLRRGFAGADLGCVRAADLWFEDCDFSRSDLQHATFDGSFFRFCRFDHANLQSASLRKATFAGCNFTDANLTYADLRDARFSYVNTGTDEGLTVMTGIQVAGAKTDGVITERVVGLPVSLV